jgi:p-hydroxybenzoate 3-monooxygenase
LLAGDAAHIVPPTGAKGLNLAVADVWRLSQAIEATTRHGDDEPLRTYSARSLDRAWRVQRFSWWMTALLHRDADADWFDAERQLADLKYLVGSRAAQTTLAENYTGFPLA